MSACTRIQMLHVDSTSHDLPFQHDDCDCRKNNIDDHVVEATELPAHLVVNATGKSALNEQFPRVSAQCHLDGFAETFAYCEAVILGRI